MMRKNQKGFTLVELIIAVAILAIVTLAVCGFIVVGSRSYTSANTDILLQQEAQLALNQISDVIIDTTDSITYSVGTGSSLQNVLKDSEYGGEATDKCLVVINRTDATSNNDNPSYWFYWQKDLETIYFNELPAVNPSMSYDEIQAELVNADSGRAILAEHVTDLNIDISQFEENRVVMISMTLKNGNREYSTSNNVTVRNRIALNVVDIDPMQRADDFLIKGVASVILEPGDEYTFKPIVDTSSRNSDFDDALTWELVGGSAYGTTYSTSGNECTVRVGLEEQRRNFALRVKRTNEQYAGQNNRVGLTVYVEVKRVNSVNLDAEGSVTTVEPGATIKITGAASGWHLGDRDDSEINDCATVDLLTDDDLEDWARADGSADFTVMSSDASGATIKISDTVTEGQTIIVEATSSLSLKKGYNTTPTVDANPSKPGIQGILRLTVEDGIQGGGTPVRGDFKFGTDDPILDYMREGLRTDYWRYVFCVRAREMDATDSKDDIVLMYYSLAANERFAPDMFGLELNRSYKVYFQVLVPISKENLSKGDYTEDDRQTIVNEYFANINKEGRYTGTKYEAGELYSGLLSPPAVTITYGNKEYKEERYKDDSYCLHYSTLGGGETVMTRPSLNDIINVDNNAILHNLRFTLYKENSGGSWTRIYGFNSKGMDYDTSSKNSGSTWANGAFLFDPENYGQFIKKILNKSDSDYSLAEGTYYIVPGAVYANNPNVNNRNWDYLYRDPRVENSIWWNDQYFDTSASAIKLVIDNGLNLTMANGDKTYFPLPSIADFPFARTTSDVQTVKWDKFTIYSKSGTSWNWSRELYNIMVDCEYYPAVGSNAAYYKLTLYTETRTGTSYSRWVYGQYRWQTGWDEWVRQDPQYEYEDKGTDKTNITIVRDGVTYSAYLPTPSELGSRSSVTLKLIKENAKNGDDVLPSVTIAIERNGDSVKLTGVELQGKHKQATYDYGTYTYSSSSSTWNLTTPGSATKYEAVGVVTIEYNGGKYNIELPLPNMDGYPITSKQDNVGYALDDTYCERNIVMWMAFDAVYSQSGSTYTVTVTPMWNSGAPKTFTWQEGQVNWQPRN